LAYASPGIPTAAMGVPIAIYIPPFYAQEMGLGLAVVGLIFMLARFWDMITDPMLGTMSDRFPTRWGRRRHWLVLSVPIMLVATWQLFMPNPEQVSAFYLAAWLFFLYIGWTLLTISHTAWGAELSSLYNERTRVQGAREIALIVGAIVCLALPSVIEQMGPENVAMARVASMGWMVMILLPITVFWAVSKVGEKKAVVVTATSWKDIFTLLKTNAPLQRVLLCGIALGMSQGITGALFLFLAADVLQLGSWASIVLLLFFVSAIFYVPIFSQLSHKVGKHLSLGTSVIIYALAINAFWFIPAGAVLASAIAVLCLGMNMGAPPFLLRAMVGDVVDDDTVTTGKQQTGLFFALYNMTEKIGGALSIGITYLALDMLGFVPGGVNDEATLAGFKLLYIVPPIFLSLLIAFISHGFPIDKTRQERNGKTLLARQSSQLEVTKKEGLAENLTAEVS